MLQQDQLKLLKEQFHQHEQQLKNLSDFFHSKVEEEYDFICFFHRFLEYHVSKCKQALITTIQSSDIKKALREFTLDQLFPERIWNFTISDQFLDKLTKNKSDQSYFLMKLILQGRFHEKNPFLILQAPNLKQYSPKYQKIQFARFKYGITKEQKCTAILFSISPKSNYNDEKLQYTEEIQFLDLTYYWTGNEFNNLIRKEEFLQIESLLLKEKQLTIQQKQLMSQFIVIPKVFDDVSADNYIYDEKLKKWVSKQLRENYYKYLEYINYQKSINHIIKRYLFTPNFIQYQKLIQNIPSLKIKPSKSQFFALAQKEDCVVIGRSGTGKTTMSLLKLFLTDAVFNLRQNLDTKNNNSEGIKLKTLFLTASPLLAQQMKQKYSTLVKNVEMDLKEKSSSRNKQIDSILEQNQDDELNNQESSNNLSDDDSDCEIINFEDNEVDMNKQQEEIDEYEKEMGCFDKFSDLQQFPAFLTIRKLLFLIDSNLQHPFFKNKSLVDRQAQWHNELVGMFTLNQQKAQIDEIKVNNQLDEKDEITFNVQLKEVNLDIFINKLWREIISDYINSSQKKAILSLNPTTVWSEIITKIKGHEEAYLSHNKCITFQDYQNHSQPQSSETELIYKCFENYEKIKKKLGYYDLLDLVNHINFQLKFNYDLIEMVHYIVLDEVQDLPKAFLTLLSKLSIQGLFLSGDNAQNIVKGVEFKFQEILKSLTAVNTEQHPLANRKVNLYKLEYNFRSTHQILLVGNSIIRILELLFPNHLDSLPYERSSQQGKKPIFIKNNTVSQLLFCLAKFDKKKNQYDIILNQNSVIIVRDQESKPKVPVELQNMLILTIYEAKGLEFDEVILFNFFTDSSCSLNEWQFLDNLDVQQNVASNQQSGPIKGQKQKLKSENLIKQIQLRNNKDKLQQSMAISLDLKLLYVAVTRPRNKLIIFDEVLQKRTAIQRLLQKLDFIDIFDESQADVQFNSLIFEVIIDNKANWRQQGFKMFQKSNFEQAYKCFKFAEDELMAKKSIAYHTATQAAINDSARDFLTAGKLFEEIGLLKRAAQCYFSSKKYSKAYELYAQTDSKKEAAESAFLAGFYNKAGSLFNELKEVHQAIDCYERCEDWNKILNIVEMNQSAINNEEKSFYFEKYLPKIFDQITQELEQQIIVLEEIPKDDESESFSVQNSQIIDNSKLDETQSFQVQDESSFDHLSFYDPEDEWLKSDQKSLVNVLNDSISIKNPTFFINENQQQYAQVILSIEFVNNLIERLKKLKHFEDYLQDIDNQSIQGYSNDKNSRQILQVLLQQLEKQNNYKLCIFICNQFDLIDELGKYICLLMSKYSPLNNSFFKSSEKNIFKNNQKRRQLREQGTLSTIVLNNILKLVKPSYLNFKYESKLTNENCFEIETLKQFVSLGYWQNVLKFVNFEQAFDLCKSFNDFDKLIEILNLQISRGINLTQNQQLAEKFIYFRSISQILDSQNQQWAISETFYITKELLNTQQFQQQTFKELVSNIKSSTSLKQIESIILCFGILNGNFVAKINLDQKIELARIYLQCLNEIQQPLPNQNVLECLQFIYKFSYPTGELMTNFSQFIITQVDSDLFKLNSDIALPIEISFEHYLLPIESLRTLKKILPNFLEQTLQNKNIQDEFQNLEILVQSQFNYQVQSFFQGLFSRSSQNYYYKVQYHIQNENFENENENEIISLIKKQDFQDIHNSLLFSNRTQKNNLKGLRYYIIRESLELFQAAKLAEERQKHAFIIFAINLLNYCQSLPYAIFTIQQFKNIKNAETYLKYVEFLECQNQMVVEDMFDCFFNYFDQVQELIYVDEWLHHLIRLGMFIIICYKPNNKLIFPENYLKNVSMSQILELAKSPFKIENEEIIEQYFENLHYFLQICDVDYYRNQAYLIIIVYMINTPKIAVRFINQILNMCDKQNDICQKIKKTIVLDHQCRIMKYVQQNESLNHVSEEKVLQISIQIKKDNSEYDKYYQACLEHWDNQMHHAESFLKSGKKILKYWNKKNKNQQVDRLNQITTNKLLINKKIQNIQTLQINLAMSNRSKISEILDLQKELIKKLYQSRGNEFLAIHEQLSKVDKVIFDAINNKEISQDIENFRVWLKDQEKVIQKQNDQIYSQQKHIRETLKKKWQNLKAGIKIQNQQKQNMQSKNQVIQELEDEYQIEH